MTALRKVLICFAVAACTVLAVGVRQAAAAEEPNFETINCPESLPPLSVESRTNGVHLSFAGTPTHKFSIQRAPALIGPWTTINLHRFLDRLKCARERARGMGRTAASSFGRLPRWSCRYRDDEWEEIRFPVKPGIHGVGGTEEQLNQIEISPNGIHWPALNELLSFRRLLSGDYGQQREI